MNDPFLEEDAVAPHQIQVVGQEGVDETVVSLVENQKNSQPLFDQQVAEGLLRWKVHLCHIVTEQLSLMPGVLFAQRPRNVDFIQIKVVRGESRGKVRSNGGVAQLRQRRQRAIFPDFVGEQKIEHRRSGLIGINIERQIDLVARFAIDVLQDRLGLSGIGALEVRNVNSDPRASADFDRLTQGRKNSFLVADVCYVQA